MNVIVSLARRLAGQIIRIGHRGLFPHLFPLSFLFAEGIDQQLNFPQFFSICPHLLRRTAGCGNIPVSASFRAEQRSQLTVKCGIVTVVMGDMGTCIFTSVLHALFPPFAV